MSFRASLAASVMILLILALASLAVFRAFTPGAIRALEVTPEDVQLDPVMVGEARTFEITLKNVSEDLVEFAPLWSAALVWTCGSLMLGCNRERAQVCREHFGPGGEAALFGMNSSCY